MSLTTDYLERLERALTARGISGAEADDVLAEARAHLEDDPADPEAALGAPEAWAAALASRGGATADYEERTITGVTAFSELAALEQAGSDGWELVGCGPFVLHLRRRADPDDRVAIEHQRIKGSAQRDRELVAAGWELATTWLVFRYYRRPRRAA